METSLVWTGSVILSGVLLVPVLLEFFKRNLSICFGLLATMLTIYCLAPYSAGARNVWAPLSKIPEDVAQAITALVGHPSEIAAHSVNFRQPD